jgi:hypothetical protein
MDGWEFEFGEPAYDGWSKMTRTEPRDFGRQNFTFVMQSPTPSSFQHANPALSISILRASSLYTDGVQIPV